MHPSSTLPFSGSTLKCAVFLKRYITGSNLDGFCITQAISDCSPMRHGAKLRTLPVSNCNMTGSPEPVSANSNF